MHACTKAQPTHLLKVGPELDVADRGGDARHKDAGGARRPHLRRRRGAVWHGVVEACNWCWTACCRVRNSRPACATAVPTTPQHPRPGMSAYLALWQSKLGLALAPVNRVLRIHRCERVGCRRAARGRRKMSGQGVVDGQQPAGGSGPAAAAAPAAQQRWHPVHTRHWFGHWRPPSPPPPEPTPNRCTHSRQASMEESTHRWRER